MIFPNGFSTAPSGAAERCMDTTDGVGGEGRGAETAQRQRRMGLFQLGILMEGFLVAKLQRSIIYNTSIDIIIYIIYIYIYTYLVIVYDVNLHS